METGLSIYVCCTDHLFPPSDTVPLWWCILKIALKRSSSEGAHKSINTPQTLNVAVAIAMPITKHWKGLTYNFLFSLQNHAIWKSCSNTWSCWILNLLLVSNCFSAPVICGDLLWYNVPYCNYIPGAAQVDPHARESTSTVTGRSASSRIISGRVSRPFK